MWLIVQQLPIKAGWWDAPLTLRDFSQSNKQNCFVGFPVKILILAVSSLAMKFVETVLHLYDVLKSFLKSLAAGKNFKIARHYYSHYISAAVNLCNCTCFQIMQLDSTLKKCLNCIYHYYRTFYSLFFYLLKSSIETLKQGVKSVQS